jgi:TDG/mug DNA glycosylase family protein
MTRVVSFPPIAHASARILILGTMPGAASLQAQQYYAHPRNAFWKILARLLQFDPALDYAARKRCLIDARFAVWDVLKSCDRPGSLDSNIAADSIVTNDFSRFFARHRDVELVCFNGAAAQTLFRRHVTATLADAIQLDYVALPSTSPANASMPVSQKLVRWRAALLCGAMLDGVTSAAPTRPSVNVR